jgi:hypothetical protein
MDYLHEVNYLATDALSLIQKSIQLRPETLWAVSKAKRRLLGVMGRVLQRN